MVILPRTERDSEAVSMRRLRSQFRKVKALRSSSVDFSGDWINASVETQHAASSLKNASAKPRAITALIQTDNPDVAFLHLFERSRQVDDAGNVHVLRSARRCLRNCRVNRRSSTLGNHDSVDSGAISGADKRPKVVRILHTVEHDDKNVLSVFMSKNFIEFGIIFAGYDGNDSLVRLGSRKAVKLFTRNKAQRNA